MQSFGNLIKVDWSADWFDGVKCKRASHLKCMENFALPEKLVAHIFCHKTICFSCKINGVRFSFLERVKSTLNTKRSRLSCAPNKLHVHVTHRINKVCLFFYFLMFSWHSWSTTTKTLSYRSACLSRNNEKHPPQLPMYGLKMKIISCNCINKLCVVDA